MKQNEDILICGVNWLGDACMSMPALQLYYEQNNAPRITMLTKAVLKPLWEMHPAVSDTITLETTTAGMFRTSRLVKNKKFNSAYILPNSWRSALIPFMAHIPNRIGQTGHHRQLLLTETTQPAPERYHQQWEYAAILKLQERDSLPSPSLSVPADAMQSIAKMLPTEDKSPLIGILPGAARGPSKQWPAEHYIAAAKIVIKSCPARFAVMGTKAEAPLCECIAAAIGNNTVSIAGRTSLQELIATLSCCDTVLCNDSGGMHLAASTGTPVVAIYGITDAEKTGPLGEGHRIIQARGVEVSRSIPRNSPEARAALKSISSQEVAAAALAVIEDKEDKGTE